MKNFTLLTSTSSVFSSLSLDSSPYIIEDTNVTPSVNMETFDVSPYRLSTVLAQLEHRLALVKNKLDKYYVHEASRTNFDKILCQLDFFRPIKRHLIKNNSAQCVTNAWLKTWELISFFSLITLSSKIKSSPSLDGWKTINRIQSSNRPPLDVHLYSCLPGSPIAAINHYVNTLTSYALLWTASSNSSNVEDTFQLRRTYPSNWMTLPSIENIIQTKKHFISPTHDFYFSDFGLDDIQDDYNNQENLHSFSNLSQIYLGLISLKLGGHMCTKQYTFFTPFTVSLILILTNIFEEVHICKPCSSKIFNSETYLVCKNFLGLPAYLQSLLTSHLLTFKIQGHDQGMPLFDMRKLDERQQHNLQIIEMAAQEIFISQIESIDFAIQVYEQYVNTEHELSLFPVGQEIRKKYNPEGQIALWFQKYQVRPLKNRFHLKCFDS